MDANEFSQRLSNLSPSLDNLQQRGFTPEGAIKYQNSFYCGARAKAVSNQDKETDPLLKLIQCYDCSEVQIGIVRFLDHIIESPTVWQVGYDEADPLVVDKSTGEVRVEQLSNRDYVIVRCAKDGGKFLDAMLHIAYILEQCAEDEELSENQLALKNESVKCATFAGGPMYLPYYLYLLGVE